MNKYQYDDYYATHYEEPRDWWHEVEWEEAYSVAERRKR